METSRKQTQNIQNKIIKELEAIPDKNPLFSDFDDEVLRRFYPTKNTKAIAEKLDKSVAQIRHRVQELGVRKIR